MLSDLDGSLADSLWLWEDMRGSWRGRPFVKCVIRCFAEEGGYVFDKSGKG